MLKPYVIWRHAKWPVSFLIAKRSITITVTLLALTMVLAIVSTGMGEMKIAPLDVLKVLFGTGAEQHALVVQTFRLPRIVIAILVGASLAVAGAILQGLVRNPLASPDVIGISGGASVTAVAFITLFETASIRWLPFSAMLGALVAAVLLYLLAWKKGVTPLRLVLIGIGLKVLTAAITTYLVSTSPPQLTSKAVIWLTGSIYGTNWSDVLLILPWSILLIVATMLLTRHANLLQLGEEIATGAGSPVQWRQFQLLFLCVALTGVAVAVGGAIGFVALLAPHIAKILVGPAYEGVVPVSALTGALMVLLADLAGRTLFAPVEVAVGAITSAIGAPFFIYLLIKSKA